MMSTLPAIFLGVVAASSVAAAQSVVLSFTSVPNPVTDGSPQALTYRTNDTITPVTIVLQQGLNSTNLTTVYNLTTTATGGQYVWTPSTDLPNGDDYALEIMQGDQINFFGPFRVQGYLGPISTSSATASTTVIGSNGTTALSYGTISISTGSAMSRNVTLSGASGSAPTTSTIATVTATSTTYGTACVNYELNTGVALMAALGAVLLG